RHRSAGEEDDEGASLRLGQRQLAPRPRSAEERGAARPHRSVAPMSHSTGLRQAARLGAARTASIMNRASLDVWSAPKPQGTRARLAIGTMNFGKRADEALARRIIDHAAERGLDFLDTANVYNDGESERIVGRAVKGRREKFVIATKAGFGRVNGKAEGLSR